MPVTRYPHIPGAKSPILEDHTLVTRYLPFPMFLDFLNGNLAFTSMKLLRDSNDPLECRSIATSQVIMTELTNLPAGGGKAIKDVLKLASKWVRHLSKDPGTRPHDRSHYIAAAFHNFIEQSRAASCWYASPFESAGMWKAFAPEGVAIRTTLKKLEDALPRKTHFQTAAVRYVARERFLIDIGNYPKFSDLVLRPYLAKGMEFEHEREVRIVTKCEPGEQRVVVKMTSFSKTIEQIILSPFLNKTAAQAMRKHILKIISQKSRKGPSANVSYSSINSRLIFEAEEEAQFESLAGLKVDRNDAIPL
jgi:hypothetical protein